jgi:hypothetical protein
MIHFHPSTRAVPRSTRSWRDGLPIHPAVELFSPMSPAELKALGEDIRQQARLTHPIALCMDSPGDKASVRLVDGRNRLDALEQAGIKFELKWRKQTGIWVLLAEGLEPSRCDDVCSDEVLTYVISANLRRRHLTARKKRELIANLIKADPSKSDRQIGKMVNVNDKTVAKVRRKMEGRSEIPNVDTRIDTKGRKQPARKSRFESKPEPESESKPKLEHETDNENWDTGEIARDEAESRGIDSRKPACRSPLAPNPLPSNSRLPAFNLAIKFLMRLQGESPIRFAQTYHSVEDLERVEAFIRAVIEAKTTAPASASGASTRHKATETPPLISATKIGIMQ